MTDGSAFKDLTAESKTGVSITLDGNVSMKPTNIPEITLKTATSSGAATAGNEASEAINDGAGWFDLKPEKDGWWNAEFDVKGSKISRIEITAVGGKSTDPKNHEMAKNAKVYVGETLCGTLQSSIDRHMVYTIFCDTSGD